MMLALLAVEQAGVQTAGAVPASQQREVPATYLAPDRAEGSGGATAAMLAERRVDARPLCWLKLLLRTEALIDCSLCFLSQCKDPFF